MSLLQLLTRSDRLPMKSTIRPCSRSLRLRPLEFVAARPNFRVPNARPPLMDADENERLQTLEDELVADNVLDYLLPRQVRQVVTGFSAASCLLAVLLSAVSAASNPSVAAQNGSLQNVGINFLGAAAFAAFTVWDKKDGERRMERRRRVRKEQLASGEREIIVDARTGRQTSRLVPVEDDLVLRRLEKMAKKENLPFCGPEKAAILQQLVRERRPRVAVEVGTMAGYAAIQIARALPEDPAYKLITIEKDLQWSLAARRFLSQASEGKRKVPIGEQVEVWLGDARTGKLQEVAEKFGPIEFLFLDGVPKESLEYLKAAEPYLAPGCVIAADNAVVFKDGGMKNYNDYVRGSAGYSSRTELCSLEFRPDVEDGIEVSIKL